MFRKLVSHLSFSPAVIQEVGFYARRLRREEATRQLTVVFMALALIIQSLSIVSPPESANASSQHDLLLGGTSSKEDFIARYNTNDSNIKDILTTAGITDEEIAKIENGEVHSKDNTFVMGRMPRFGGSAGEVPFKYIASDTGQSATAYISPLRNWDTGEVAEEFGTEYEAYIGNSAKLGWFAILKYSGNLVTKSLPIGVDQPQTGITQTISATNITQGGVVAESVVADPGDHISYTITAKNDSSNKQLVPLVVELNDVMEYATLIDNGNALFGEKTHTISWPPSILAPGDSESRTFVIRINDPISATPHGQSNTMSYDCILSSTYGTGIHIKVDCPAVKNVEAAVGIFPEINSTGSIIFGLISGGLVAFFYLRTRQLEEEIRLIRHNLNQGAL